MAVFFRCLGVAWGLMALASCGGGIQVVTGVTVPNLRYTGAVQVITVQLSGKALTASGMKVYANNIPCANDSSTSETDRKAFCTLTLPDDLTVRIRVTNVSNEDNFNGVFTAPLPQVTLNTTLGDVVFELNPLKAPISVKNFLAYVNQSPSFYDGTLFHRVIPNFVVQGGGFTTGMVAKTGLKSAIALESNNGLKNQRGTVAMARTDAADSATSQFYVNLVDNTSLDYVSASSPGYAVFGTVVSGMDVIDTISKADTTTVGSYSNVPRSDILVTTAKQTR